MNRVDLLPENTVRKFLADLESEANELKNSFQLTGGANMVYKQSDTGATSDWSGTLPHGGGANPYNAQFLVTASASTEGVLLADIVWQVKVNGVTKTNGDANLYNIYTYPKTSNTNIQQWYAIVFWTNNTDTIAVKAYVLATDAAALTVVAL